MKKLPSVLIPIAALLIGFAPGFASANPVQTVTAVDMAFASPTTVKIQYKNNAKQEINAGAFITTASDTSGSFLSWCIDIFQSTYFGQPVNDYDRKAANASAVASKANTLQNFASQSLSKVHDSLTSAAFQIGIWEIINETGSVYNLTSGDFRVSNASDGSIALAKQWLNTLPGATGPAKYKLSMLESHSRQDLLVFTEVPEPSSIAIFMTGLIGFAIARRKFVK